MSTGGFATLYLDGAVVAAGTFLIDTAPDTDFYIGRIPGGIGEIRRLDGLVDEVRMYDTALSASEMAALAGIPEPSSLILVAFGTAILGWGSARPRRLART